MLFIKISCQGLVLRIPKIFNSLSIRITSNILSLLTQDAYLQDKNQKKIFFLIFKILKFNFVYIYNFVMNLFL